MNEEVAVVSRKLSTNALVAFEQIERNVDVVSLHQNLAKNTWTTDSILTEDEINYILIHPDQFVMTIPTLSSPPKNPRGMTAGGITVYYDVIACYLSLFILIFLFLIIYNIVIDLYVVYII